MRVDLNKLEHLVAVADAESFSKAGQKLNLTQPALSRSVAESERRLGVKIFDRRRNGISPTPSGTAIIAEARRLLQHALSFEHSLYLFARGELGQVSFAMAPIVASIALAPLTTAMLAKSPRIELHPSINVSDKAINDLRSDLIDVAFLPMSKSNPNIDDLEIEFLFDLSISVLVRAGHPLASDCTNLEDIWHYKVASGTGVDFPPINAGSIVCSNFDILKKITMDSDVVWFSSDMLAEAELASGKLVKLCKIEPAWHCAIVHKRGQLSPSVETLISEVKALFLPAESL